MELKNKIKGMGLKMGDVADKLGMSRQNLGIHLRKAKPDASFREKLFAAYPELADQANMEPAPVVDVSKEVELLERIIESKDNEIALLKQQLQTANQRNAELTDIINRELSKHRRAV